MTVASLQFVVITGLSGAGKSQAIDAFEDAGYFCVDNLPPQLVPTLVDLFRREGSKVDKVAIVSDVRGGEYFGQLEQLLAELHDRGVEYVLVFLEASNEALVRRFKETRRRHPLGGGTVIDGIRKERALLAGLRDRATLIIDTSSLSDPGAQGSAQPGDHPARPADEPHLCFVSFGYKYGIPIDGDLLFDVRFLPNPFYDLRLRQLTGLDPEVTEFVLDVRRRRRVLRAVCSPLLDFLFPRYAAEGKAHLTIGIGCTGGRHRSVTVAAWLGRPLRGRGTSPSCVIATSLGTDETAIRRVAPAWTGRQALGVAGRSRHDRACRRAAGRHRSAGIGPARPCASA